MTSTSNLFKLPCPLDDDSFFGFLLFLAMVELPSRNSSSRPGVPMRILALVSLNLVTSFASELPPMSRSGGGKGAVEVLGCESMNWVNTPWICVASSLSGRQT